MNAPAPLAQLIDQTVTSTGRRRKRMSVAYDGIIDLLLANPTMTQKEIGVKLSRSAVWVGYVIRSDAFNALLAERRAEKNKLINVAITSRLGTIAVKSLEIVEKRLSENPLAIPMKVAMETADTALERLGYGVKLPNPGTGVYAPGSMIFTVQSDELAAAQARIRLQEAGRAETTKNVTPAAPPTAVSSGLVIEGTLVDEAEETGA